MGGRGGMGGSRSTYRGNDTALFRERQLAKDTGAVKDGGGASTKNKEKKQMNADTGGIQGNGKKGDGGAVADTPKEPVSLRSNMTQAELEELFGESDEYAAFEKRDFPSVLAEQQAFLHAFNKWKAANSAKAPPAQPGATPEPDAPKTLADFPALDKIASTEEEIRVDIRKVNPNFDNPELNVIAQPGVGEAKRRRSNVQWRINCQRVVLAVEGRFRGRDVDAESVENGYKPVPWLPAKKRADGSILRPAKHNLDLSASHGQIAGLFKKADGKSPKWTWSTGNRVQRIQSTESEVLSWGEGARGIVFVTWSQDRGAHVFNVQVKNGQVLYLDGQTGSYGDTNDGGATGFRINFEDASDYGLGVLRVDDTEITPTGLTWMRARNSLQRNLPSEAQLTAKIDNMDINQMKVWNHVYQQVRVGGKVTLPPEWASIPEIVNWAKEAAAWCRRP